LAKFLKSYLPSRVRRKRRNRKFRLRHADWSLIFCFSGRFLSNLGRTARTERSHRLAQTNSIARIASPAGITMKAGPGNTIMATPMASTVPPKATTATLFNHFMPGSGSVAWLPRCKKFKKDRVLDGHCCAARKPFVSICLTASLETAFGGSRMTTRTS